MYPFDCNSVIEVFTISWVVYRCDERHHDGFIASARIKRVEVKFLQLPLLVHIYLV